MNTFNMNAERAAPLLAAVLCLGMAAGCGPMALGDRGGPWYGSGGSSSGGVASQGSWGGGQGGTGGAPPSSRSGGAGTPAGSGREQGAGRTAADTKGGCSQPPCVVLVTPEPAPSPPIKPAPDSRTALGRETAVTPKREALVAPRAGIKANPVRPVVKPRAKDLRGEAAIRQP